MAVVLTCWFCCFGLCFFSPLKRIKEWDGDRGSDSDKIYKALPLDWKDLPKEYNNAPNPWLYAIKTKSLLLLGSKSINQSITLPASACYQEWYCRICPYPSLWNKGRVLLPCLESISYMSAPAFVCACAHLFVCTVTESFSFEKTFKVIEPGMYIS